MRRIFLSLVSAVFLLSPAVAQPGGDPDGVKQTAASLLQKEDFAGLDKLATDIKAKGYDIRQKIPELDAFYGAFHVDEASGDPQWLDQQQKLERWGKAQPASVTAKIALANWYTSYGWKARGTGFAAEVTGQGWLQMGERLKKASEILKAIPKAQIDDPEYYCLWPRLEAEPNGTNQGSGEKAFKEGVEKFKEYYPLYRVRVNFLLPKWFGAEGAWEKFTLDAANTFPGEKGDILYARLARSAAHSYDENEFFQKCTVDYARIKRGFYAAAAGENEPERIEDLSDFCYLAASHGDTSTAASLFLDLGSFLRQKSFGLSSIYFRMRKACGVDEALEKAAAADRAGNFDEEQKLWASFPAGVDQPWLGSFASRPRWADSKKGAVYSGLLQADVATADPDMLAGLCKMEPQLGDWGKAEAAARAFDQKRPWNLTGKNTLWLCALRNHDKAASETARQQILALKTDRPAYLTAQAVLSGAKPWEQACEELPPRDTYLTQAVMAIALHYLTQGDVVTARRIVRKMVPVCKDRDAKALLESTLFGDVSKVLGLPEVLDD
jgi:hypothetical protein